MRALTKRCRGSAGLVAVLAVLALAVALALVATTALAALDANRVRDAADAVALAEALDERGAAVAAANAVTLEAVVRRGPCVEVLVRRGRIRARARAAFDYPWADRPDAACVASG